MTRIIPRPTGEIGANTGADFGPYDIPASGIRAKFAAAVWYVLYSFAGERTRWALWIPVCLGIGIAYYFSLQQEPEIWVGPTLCGVALLAAAGMRHKQALLLLVFAAVFIFLGFGVAQLRTALVAAPVLHKKLGPVSLEGRVARIETLTKGRRLWLDRVSVDRLDADKTPKRIRIKLYAKKANVRPGDRVRLRSILHPPSGPAMPGAFDFARRAYFQQLGGVGYAISRPVDLSRAGSIGFSIWLAALRHRITETIHKTLPGPAGAVAAALITGERGAIPEDVLVAMRESGLVHLLAISGLHIGLVGGLLFFSVRLGLAWPAGKVWHCGVP